MRIAGMFSYWLRKWLKLAAAKGEGAMVRTLATVAKPDDRASVKIWRKVAASMDLMKGKKGVIFGVSTGTSVTSLFMGGFFPGFLIGFSHIAYCYWFAKKHGYTGSKEPFDGKYKLKQLEIDFVANKGNKKYYIQSAYEMPTERFAEPIAHFGLEESRLPLFPVLELEGVVNSGKLGRPLFVPRVFYTDVERSRRIVNNIGLYRRFLSRS